MPKNKYDTEPPADPETVDSLRRSLNFNLPADYINFLLSSNGAQGSLGLSPGWFQIWKAQEVIEWNRKYELPDYLPEYFAFGTNLGGEIYVFDKRSCPNSPVYHVSAIGMDDSSVLQCASSFSEFVAQMGK